VHTQSTQAQTPVDRFQQHPTAVRAAVPLVERGNNRLVVKIGREYSLSERTGPSRLPLCLEKLLATTSVLRLRGLRVSGRIRSLGGVEDERGGGRRRERLLSQSAGASGCAMIPFPVPVHRTGRADFRIRLSDWIHIEAHAGGPRCRVRRRRTPSSPKTRSGGNRRVPRVGTLCRRRRKLQPPRATYVSMAG